jgi:iron complex transport system ATP-binding protein
VNVLFSLRDVGMCHNGALLLQGATLDLPAGQMTTIVGPNGAGKSTLIEIMAGLRPRHGGRCLYREREVGQWNRRAFAREVAFVPQTVHIDFPFTAEQVVLMGRTPYCDGLFESPEDHAAVERAMRTTDMISFKNRDYRTLSGGEKQRILLASVLAQSPRALLLDEPTAFLDLQHQLSTYRLLRDLARQGMLIVTVTHDLNLAAAYSDRLLALREGSILYDAAPAVVVSSRSVRAIFNVEAAVHRTEAGRPWVLYGGE